MNQSLKRSEESRFGRPCKCTAPPAASRIYTQLIYLLPVKETTIIIFTLHAAASCLPPPAPLPVITKDSKKMLPFRRRDPPHPPSSSPAFWITITTMFPSSQSVATKCT